MDNADSRWQTYSAGLARELGGEMLHFEPQVRNSGGRQAFFADVAVGDNVRHLYVRAGRDMVPEEFAYADLSREKLVMDWLASRGVPVAAAVHLSREPVALAMEALQGEDDYLTINTTPSGEAVLTHYIEILAEMHSHDVSELTTAGFFTPTTEREVALHHFETFAVDTRRNSGLPDDPLCIWVADWLRRNAPRSAGRLSLVQGDTGPGNLVFEGDKVLGLVDWELAHLGDPMEDLGVLRLRDVWTPFPGGVRRYFDQYEQITGRPVDFDAVRWYSIRLCMIHPFVLAIPVHYPALTSTPAEWLAEYYSLTRLGLEEIALVSGVTLQRPELPPPRLTLQSAYHDVLTDALRDEVIPRIEDPYERYRAEQAWRTAQYLRGSERYLAAIQEIEITEIAEITATAARTHTEAIAALVAFVEEAPAEADGDLIRFFYRQQSRMEALMPGAIGRGEGRSFSALD